CISALGTQLRGKSIESFDHRRQVYSKAELSPLPFTPPAAYTYFVTMLSGTFKVFQYVITVMVALMVTQHSIERYWSAGRQVSSFQAMMFALFVSYPLLTLLLVVLTNNEMAVRRFMYYRLMSLQVIVDWENTPFYKMWFCIYFVVTFCLINLYSLYASWLTWSDKTTSVLPQWSIMFMQSMLLFMFWFNMVSLEEQLVPLNKELITKCTVVTEKAFKTAIRKTTQRKRAFKRLTAAQQDAAAAELLGERGDSAAAFFDLMGLRRTGSNRVTQEDVAVEEVEPPPKGCFAWLKALSNKLDALTVQRLYAFNFCTSFLTSLTLLRTTRSGKPGPHMWPYPGDVRYLRAMAVLGTLCMLSVVAVEAYAIWFLIYANDIKDRDTFGILECKQCYGYIDAAGDSCSSKPADNACWGAAKLGYCAMRHALLDGYGMNATTWLDSAGCAAYLPALPAV
ncbi:hypothetical protein OEZ85_000762, partial [Tetradesmus obliquus]